MRIISINAKHTTSITSVAFNIEDPPVSDTIQYGTLSVRIEDGILKVTSPNDDDIVDTRVLQNIIAKFAAADEKIADRARQEEKQRQSILAVLSQSTRLPVE